MRDSGLGEPTPVSFIPTYLQSYTYTYLPVYLCLLNAGTYFLLLSPSFYHIFAYWPSTDINTNRLNACICPFYSLHDCFPIQTSLSSLDMAYQIETRLGRQVLSRPRRGTLCHSALDLRPSLFELGGGWVGGLVEDVLVLVFELITIELYCLHTCC